MLKKVQIILGILAGVIGLASALFSQYAQYHSAEDGAAANYYAGGFLLLALGLGLLWLIVTVIALFRRSAK